MHVLLLAIPLAFSGPALGQDYYNPSERQWTESEFRHELGRAETPTQRNLAVETYIDRMNRIERSIHPDINRSDINRWN